MTWENLGPALFVAVAVVTFLVIVSAGLVTLWNWLASL